jgi:hypothetical protein
MRRAGAMAAAMVRMAKMHWVLYTFQNKVVTQEVQRLFGLKKECRRLIRFLIFTDCAALFLAANVIDRW